MFCADTPSPIFLIFTNAVPALLYYSHIPAIIISLMFGFFVYFKSDNLARKALLFLSLVFSFWSVSNLVVWTNPDSRLVLFFWGSMLISEALIFISSFYFIYLFIEKRDISLWLKISIGLLFLPIVFLAPTEFNLYNFDISANCGPSEGFVWDYLHIFDVVFFVGVLVFSILKYRLASHDLKKQTKYVVLGIEFFLGSFFVAGYVSSKLYDLNFDYAFQFEQYGLFSMTVFVGFLAYSIVKFKAFNIKLIGAQALVYGLVILIGSQFFFITSNTNRILTGITLVLAVGFGIFLIRSVKEEVRRKEELQDMTEKLAVSNDKLRELDNAKSEFISIASHQLRTPLTSIKGYISLITEGTYGKINEGIVEPLSNVYASNERLINLVEDLLNVSRIESGRMEYVFRKCKVEDIIKNLYDTFSVIAKGKGLYLHLNFPENPLPEIEVDEVKTREVVSNLIDNALKYTKRGGVTVKAELLNNREWNVSHMGGKPETLNGNLVKISVSDTGMGVPDTELPYLFSKFSRGKDTSRLHVTGTGLGLYVGKSMIEAQHGRIYVESEGSGKGAKFIIELPVAQPRG